MALIFNLITYAAEALSSFIMTLFFLPYRLLSRVSEKSIERPRHGGWDFVRKDQILLNFASAMAFGQTAKFGMHPISANRALKLTRLLGVA